MVPSRSHDLIKTHAYTQGGLFGSIYQNCKYSFDPAILILRIYPTDTHSQEYNDVFTKLSVKVLL